MFPDNLSIPDEVKFYLSIDDTDNHESSGSGELAAMMASELHNLGLVTQFSGISRHQLFVHRDIPYTSHNSSMCFSAVAADSLEKVIQFAGAYLQKNAAPGSDPGLCVAAEESLGQGHSLVAFGLQAKNRRLSKQEAYALAREAGVHLSEHGGTGDGIIGALAGIGLRLQGNDGRFRGWLKSAKAGDVIDLRSLLALSAAEAVVALDGNELSDDSRIVIAEDTIKTICHTHRQVVPVTAAGNSIEGAAWRTLTRAEVKRF